MDSGFINILQKLVDEQGKAALTDRTKGRAFLSDYTGNEYKKEKRLILLAIEEGMARTIDETNDLEPCKKACIRDLDEDYSLAANAAQDIINTLALVLRGDTTETQSPTAQQTANLEKSADTAEKPAKLDEQYKPVKIGGTSTSSYTPPPAFEEIQTPAPYSSARTAVKKKSGIHKTVITLAVLAFIFFIIVPTVINIFSKPKPETAPQNTNSRQTTTTPEVTGPQFPAGIIGTWKMENSPNEKTMNFTANTWATSGSGIRMTLISISGDWYEVTSGGSYPSFEKLNLKLVNGKLEVREEDPYWSTGTWVKQ